MGFVPIIVALLGLIVLYTGYTYNKIKPLKANVTRVIDQMAEVSRKRKMLIIEFDRAHPGSSLEEAAAQLKKTSTDRFQSYKKEQNLLTLTNEGAKILSDDATRGEILALNQQQEGLIKKLEASSNVYNGMIAKAPASTVASLFGFRPF